MTGRGGERVGAGRRLGLAVIAVMLAITVSTALYTLVSVAQHPAEADWRQLGGSVQLVAFVAFAQVAVAVMSMVVIGPFVMLLSTESQVRHWEWVAGDSLLVLPVLLAMAERDQVGQVFEGWAGIWVECVALASSGLYLWLLGRARRSAGEGLELGLQLLFAAEVVGGLLYSGMCLFPR